MAIRARGLRMKVLFECQRCLYIFERYHNVRVCPKCKARALHHILHGPDLINIITKIVRQADAGFEISGGGSRHWVRDHFLPLLEREGFRITKI